MAALLILHLLSTAAMAGLIWFVQIVHYPLFGSVGLREFADYEKEHQFRTMWVVGPLMLTEAATASLLMWRPAPSTSDLLPAFGLALVALLWLTTLCCQMPAHARLANSYSLRWHRWLVTSNWLRTIAWTARVGIAAVMCAGAM